MKRWLSLVVVGASIQACTVMDGEHERLQKKPAESGNGAGTTEARAHEGTSKTDAGALPLTSVDASVATGPVVECGGNSCSGAQPFCCASIDTGTCVDSKTTVCPGDRFLMRCDDHGDCAGGDQVCCAWWDNTASNLVWESACTTKAACTPATSADGQQAIVRMCQSDADCPTGKRCNMEATNWEGTGIKIKSAFCEI